MAQGADDCDDDDEAFESFPDPEVARIVLELDRTITRRRRAGAMGHLVEGRAVPLPVKPSHIELRVLTSLAQTYGAVLFGQDFGPVLDRIAECGAVVLVQRALWGERPDDVRWPRAYLQARDPVRDPVRDLARGVHGRGARRTAGVPAAATGVARIVRAIGRRGGRR